MSEASDRCPGCSYVFPEIVAIGTKPDTISGITSFGVVVECPKCLQMSTIEIETEEMARGEDLPTEELDKRRRKRSDRESN